MLDIPLVLLHHAGPDKVDYRLSCVNASHQSIARDLVHHLCRLENRPEITVLCFYSGTKRVLERILEGMGCNIFTIDQYQGQESDIVVLVTTRSGSEESEDENYEFFLDSARVTVALSRARDGLLIVGNFSLLLQRELWHKYVSTATQSTPILTRDYISAMDRSIDRDRGGLLQIAPRRSILSTEHEWLNQNFRD